eukprot:TRINITY_DN3509_c0_g1_i1.p1 TRINITY_DN3509_c0_g1~~TRINITY_DN3509_c0_g1_i1.p1  ORF type:complete len:949 (-),score=233.22 TRINITY_DN3509_c0_g1_i1:67-2913(-)
MSFCLPFSKSAKKKSTILEPVPEVHTTETKVPQKLKPIVSQKYKDRHEVKNWTFPPDLEERLLKNIKNIPLANLDKPLCPLLCTHNQTDVGDNSPLYSPQTETDLRAFLPFIAGRTVSTYPENILPPQEGELPALHSYNDPLTTGSVSRQGDPIADKFGIRAFENGFAFCLADGCGWGPESRDAAQNAVNSFLEEIQRLAGARLGKKGRRSVAVPVNHSTSNLENVDDDERNLIDIARGMIRAFEVAHNTITSGKKTSFTVGTTTCLAGVIMRALEGEEWRMITVGVGDCRAYHLTYHNSKNGIPIIRDATPERLYSSDEVKNKEAKDAGKARYMNFSDCGGRIGPLLEGCAPDLRNCAIGICDLREGDLVMIVSDGVYDNLDPQHFGITPDALGIDLVMSPRSGSSKMANSSKDMNNNNNNIGQERTRKQSTSSRSPTQPIIAGKDWEKVVDWQAVDEIKKKYMTEFIRDILLGTTPPGKANVNFVPVNESKQVKFNPTGEISASGKLSKSRKKVAVKSNLQPGEVIGAKHVVESLLRHCTLVTESSRKWMEQNPLQRQPRDYAQFPGKLDHSTCLAIHLAHNLPMPPQMSTSDPDININLSGPLVHSHRSLPSSRGARSNSEGSVDPHINATIGKKIELIPTGISKTNRKAIQAIIKKIKDLKASGSSHGLTQGVKIHWKQPDSSQQTIFNILFSHTTHLLVDRLNTSSLKPKRTYKIMRGIVEGKWIVYWDWLESCLINKEWVNEEEFEAKDIYPGCVYGRERRELNGEGVFSGMYIRIGKNTMLEKGEGRKGVWQELVELMGGKIIDEERNDNKGANGKEEDREEYWVMGEGEEGVKGKEGKWVVRERGKDVEWVEEVGAMAKRKKWRVKEGWLLDCVYFYDVVSPEAYFVDQGDVELYKSMKKEGGVVEEKQEKKKEKESEESEASESTEQRDEEESEKDDFY